MLEKLHSVTMVDFSELRSAIENLATVWSSRDWNQAIDDLAKEVKAGCQDEFFDGCCDTCSIERDCTMVYELGSVAETVEWRDIMRKIRGHD